MKKLCSFILLISLIVVRAFICANVLPNAVSKCKYGTLKQLCAFMLIICSYIVCLSAYAWGTGIPADESKALQDLYTSTNGPSWTSSAGSTTWGDAGSECQWYGVMCDTGQNHVIYINLYGNNLTGSLSSLTGLTSLQSFVVSNNHLTGSIPSLTGLTNLQEFYVYNNQLTGSIPSLTGLTNLRVFNVYNNQLTGSIPSLTGLSSLLGFEVGDNQLTGSIPSLAGLTNLGVFYADDNQLTGSIPSLAGLTNLEGFYVDSNQLTGSIPSLAGLTNLEVIYVYSNQLTGSIPSLTGLTNLSFFVVSDNQLTGSIPSLTGLANLVLCYVDNNQLTGSIPSLTGLTNLGYFYVSNNYLSGDVPAVPSPNSLLLGGSLLCPNDLNATSNAAWDAATGITPWYQNCTAGPAKFSVNYDGNGCTGGWLPDTGSIYTTGDTVSVHGNTGALYQTGDSFNGWNTAADGSGTPYVGGNTFVISSVNIILYAQWTSTSAYPVRISTGTGYPDIQAAYSDNTGMYTIQAWDGLRGQNLVFNNPVSVKLIGGYDSTFTTNSGATLVSGSIQISNGSIEIANIIIQ